MEQMDIAPLARRLAEENNVDWRRLRGSGDRGRVVERDVLEYLARVMAGEEAVDPTPEPLPDGMEAWPDDDVRAFEREQHGEEPPPLEGHATVDDEIFLLETDGPDTVAEAPGGNGHSGFGDAGDDLLDMGVDVSDDLDEDDLLIAGDDEPHASAEPAPVAWRDVDDEVPPVVTPEFDDARHGEVMVSSGGGAHGPLPDLFDASDDELDAHVSPVFEEAGLGQPSGTSAASGPSLDEDAFAHGDGAPSWRSAAADVVFADESADESNDASGDVSVDEPLDVGSDAWSHGAGAAPSVPATEVAAEAAAEAAAEPMADAAAVAEAEVAAGAQPPVLAEAEPEAHDVPTVATTPAADLPLVQHGAVWRRQVDLTGLVAAQSDVARDLGLDRPVPALAFLARAGVKAAPHGAVVAVAVLGEGGVRLVRVDPELRFGDLARQAVAGPSADGSADAPDLIVADLSELEVDEAVLHLGAPVLCLGRVLIDSSTGGRRGLLSLAGDGTSSASGRILAKAADLLETPIRLVL